MTSSAELNSAAENGIVTTVPDCALVTVTVLEPIRVRVPAGKAPPLFTYKRTVTGWVLLADSIPKETEVTR